MKNAFFVAGTVLIILLSGCGTEDRSDNINLTQSEDRNKSDEENNASNATAFRIENGALDCSALGNCFLFEGVDPKHGYEPWITDGLSGAFMMADTNEAESGSDPSSFFSVGGQIYFEARTPEYGKELYKLNPLTLEVNFVDDLVPGPDDAHIYNKYAFKDKLFFTNTVAGQTYLYRTDAPGTGTIKLDSGSQFASFTSTKEWLYYVKDHSLCRTDGFKVESIDMIDPEKIEGVGSSLVIWKKTGERFSPNPTDFYALNDHETVPKLLASFEYLYSSFVPNILRKEDGVLYFNSAAPSGLAVEAYNYRVYRFDSKSGKLDVPVSFEYSEGGEYIYTLVAKANSFYMLTSRQYKNGSGSYSSETGAAYTPSVFFTALYRFDKNFESKTLLHLFEKNSPFEAKIKLFASVKDKLYLYASDNRVKDMYIYDTLTDSLSNLPNFDFGRYGQKVIDTMGSGMLYSLTDANRRIHIRHLDYQTDEIENVADLCAHASPYQGEEFQYAKRRLFFGCNDQNGHGTELYMFDLDEKKRRMIKNINESTLSSSWSGVVYRGNTAIIDTGNALYATNFTVNGSRLLGEFGPYRYAIPGRTAFQNIHAPSEMLETGKKIYVSAPDLNATASLFETDKSGRGNELKKLWESGSKRDEIHLLTFFGNQLYFRLEDRIDSGQVKYYALDPATHAVAEVEDTDPLIPVFENGSVVARMEDRLFVEMNGTLLRMSFDADGHLESIPVKSINRDILRAKGDKNGFFFFVKKPGVKKTGLDYTDVNSTVSVWYSDGSTDGTVRLFSFYDINLDIAAVGLVGSELVFTLNRYRWDCTSDFGTCTARNHYKTYHTSAFDTAPTLMLDTKVSVFGKDGNPNIILMQKKTGYDPFQSRYWRYDLSTDTIEELDLSSPKAL